MPHPKIISNKQMKRKYEEKTQSNGPTEYTYCIFAEG